MRRFALVASILAALGFEGCHQGDVSDRAASSAVPPAPSARAASTSARPAARAPFEVVDLFDLQHRGVSRFAYARSTKELFVSFDRPAQGAADVVYQFNVAEGRLVHTYDIEKGWTADDLFPSPDGRLLVIRLFRTEDGISDEPRNDPPPGAAAHSALRTPHKISRRQASEPRRHRLP